MTQKVSVVEGILLRRERGQPLYCLAVANQAPRLYDAGCRLFGSWQAALDAAGVARHALPNWQSLGSA